MSKLEEAKKALTLESVQVIKANKVMATAWYLAKMIAKEYGVSSKALLSTALKIAWKNVSVTVSLFDAFDDRQLLARIGFKFCKTTKAWVMEMKLGEFKSPKPIKNGRGILSCGQIERAYNHKHSFQF